MTTFIGCSDGGQPSKAEDGTIWIEGLCANPGLAAAVIPDDGVEAPVLLIHAEVASRGAIQATMRRLGFDFPAVGIVDLDGISDDPGLRVAVAATVARLRLAGTTRPEQVKLVAGRQGAALSRRNLFRLATPAYTTAPAVDHETCVAGRGCTACARACPTEALAFDGRSMAHDINACVVCGICTTTCPVGAISNPTATTDAIEAEMATAVALAPNGVGIRYRCRDSRVVAEDGWYQVEVPCTGMLTVGWLLTPRLLGATDVDAVSCSEGGCPLGNDDRLAGTLNDLQLIVPASSASPTNRGDEWLTPPSTSGTLGALVGPSDGGTISFTSADVGTVYLDPATCTACEMCANVCPTGALSSTVGSGAVELFLDPRACVACGQCVITCPEQAAGAITLRRVFDGEDRARGKRVVRREATPSCEVCGDPVAPYAMLERISSMLGDDAAVDLIGRRCLACRGR